MLFCGLWGLVAYFRGSRVTPSYTGALFLGEAIIAVQGILGMVMVVLGLLPRDLMHFLYGVASLLALPVAFTYMKGRTDREAQLVFSLVALFVFGLAIRAQTTAGG